MDKFNDGKMYILDGCALNILMGIASHLGSGDRISEEKRHAMSELIRYRLKDAIEWEEEKCGRVG